MSIYKRLFGGNKVISKTIQAINASYKEMKEYFDFLGNHGNIDRYLKAFISNPLVFMVVNRISTVTSSMPTTAVDGNGKVLSKSIVLDMLKNPNNDQSQEEFREEISISFQSTGNAYILIESDSILEERESLIILKPNKITPIFSSFGELIRYDYIDVFGRTQKYDVDDVIHIKSSNIVKEDGVYYSTGISPLEAMWIVIQSSDEKFTAEASIFKNRGVATIITNKSNIPLLDDERNRLQGEFNDDIGGANKFNGVHVTTTDLNAIQLGMSPTDLKLLEGIVSSLRLICSAYGLSSILFNDTESSTFDNYGNAVSSAYTDCYIPVNNKILSKISKVLSLRYGIDELVKTDVSKIDEVKQSTNEVAQILNSFTPVLADRAVQVMTDNEIRDMLTLESKDGGDDLQPRSNSNLNLNA